MTLRIRPTPEGFALLRADAPVRSPLGTALVVPGSELAAALAAETDGALTRVAMLALDRVRTDRAQMVAGILAYGGSDLLVYRADGPGELVARQAQQWDPVLDWARRSLGVALHTTTSVVPLEQPPRSVEALQRTIEREELFGLAALGELVALSGSLLLGLAVAHGFLTESEAWACAVLDETWQAEQWGRDAEAEAARAERRRGFAAAARFAALLGRPAAPPPASSGQPG